MASTIITDINEIEKQTHREAEGQDTITPLTNSVFLRQLSKLKHQSTVAGQSGSNKSINSIGATTPRSPLDTSLDTQSITSLNNAGKSKAPKTPENLLSLFSRGTTNSSSASDFTRSASASVKHLNAIVDAKSSNMVAEKLVDALSSMVSFNRDFVPVKSTDRQKSGRTTPKTNTLIRSDEDVVLDDEFINNIRLIVQHTEMMKRHKLSKSICACRVFMALFLFVMVIMICYFLKTVYSISESFREVENFKHFGYARSSIGSTSSSNFTTSFIVNNTTKKL